MTSRLCDGSRESSQTSFIAQETVTPPAQRLTEGVSWGSLLDWKAGRSGRKTCGKTRGVSVSTETVMGERGRRDGTRGRGRSGEGPLYRQICKTTRGALASGKSAKEGWRMTHLRRRRRGPHARVRTHEVEGRGVCDRERSL
jgi:hypothetical protein